MRVKILFKEEDILALVREEAIKRLANPSVRIVNTITLPYYEDGMVEVEVETDPAKEGP